MELSNTSGQATAPSNSLLQLMRRHPLFFFFLMALGFTWVYEFVFLVLLHLPLGTATIPGLIIGPTFSAFIMTAITEGNAGMGRLLRRYMLWRVGLPWYLVVLIGIPALLLLTVLVLAGGMRAVRPIVQVYPVAYVLIFFGGGAFFEEPGWRGFALPRLPQRYGALRGTIILGVLWAFWHLPLFLVPGFNGAGTGFAGVSIPFVEFVIGTMGMAVIFTWVFNNTRGSLLLAMLLHASADTAVPGAASPQVFLTLYVVLVVAALLIIGATRGRLSYRRYQREVVPPAPEAVVEQEPMTPGKAV